MLLKHSATYLIARGLPGLANFAALAIYTRLLSAEEYGRYALITGGIGLFNVVFFQWIRLSLLRFLPAHLTDSSTLRATILAAFGGMGLFTGVLGLALAALWPDPVFQRLILVAIPLLWVQAWLELNLELARSSLQPARYGVMIGTKAVSALTLGVLLVLWGMGEYGPMFGLMAAMLAASLLWGRKTWQENIGKPSKNLFLNFARYGFPLTATFAFSFVISASDRFFIAHYIDSPAAGIYSAAYDLAGQTLTMLMVTANLAAYPLVVRALENGGASAAEVQLRQNATLLLSIGLPSSAAFAILAPNIANVALGSDFRNEAAQLLPWVSISTFLAGLRAYYFDLSFQLGKKTFHQTLIIGFSATLNIALNIWLIPTHGIMGAAYATTAAYGIALILSAVFARKSYQLPVPWKDLAKVSFASLIMAAALWPTLAFSGLPALAAQMFLGIAVGGGLLLIQNVGGYRSIITRIISK